MECGGQSGASSAAECVSTDDATGNICHRGTRFSSKEEWNVFAKSLLLIFCLFQVEGGNGTSKTPVEFTKGFPQTTTIQFLTTQYATLFLPTQIYCAVLDLDQPLYRMWAGTAPRISPFWGWHGESPYKSEPKHDCHCIYRLGLSNSTFYMSFPHIYSLRMPKNTTALQRYTAKPHFGYFTSRGFSLSASEVVCSVVSVCGSLRAVNLFSWD